MVAVIAYDLVRGSIGVLSKSHLAFTRPADCMLRQCSIPSDVATHATEALGSTAAAVMSPLGGIHEPMPAPVTRSTMDAPLGVTWRTASVPSSEILAIKIVRAVREMPVKSPGVINVRPASEIENK